MAVKKLPKPYQFVLPVAVARAKYEAIRDYLKSLGGGGLQECAAWMKGLTKGMRVELFLLGYAVGLVPGDQADRGVTEETWNSTVTEVKRLVVDMLGSDGVNHLCVQEYTAARKFHLMATIYVAYEEML